MCTKALALGLFMLVAIGCNDQGLTEPTDVGLAPPNPQPQVLVNEWFPGGVEYWTSSSCGETIRIEAEEDHILVKETVTPSGNYKFSFQIQSLGFYAVGMTTGREWQMSPVPYTFWVQTKDDSPLAYHTHQVAHGVGRGVNTDINMYSTFMVHFNRLASGEIVVDMFISELECR